MNNYQKETLQNIRRSAERMLAYGKEDSTWLDYISSNTDTYNHIIGMVEEIEIADTDK